MTTPEASRRSAYEKRLHDIQTWARVRDLLGWAEHRFRDIASKAGRYYKPFEIRPPGAQKWRRIDNPEGELRRLQSAIQRKILCRAPGIPDYVIGGVPGRSIIDNAAIHARARVVLTMDIRDCFPSITNRHVYEAFATHLGYHPEIASAFTKVTTLNRHLPQGAPTSTMVANLALLPTLEKLSALAEERNLNFSAWIDDLTFSGPAPELIIDEAIEILRLSGFSVARRKLRIMRGWREPERVTGAVVNTTVSAGRERVRAIEKTIMALAEQGVVTDRQYRSVLGQIRHCFRLRPSQGRHLERLAERMLPPASSPGKPLRMIEYRPCRRPSRRRGGRRRSGQSARKRRASALPKRTPL